MSKDAIASLLIVIFNRLTSRATHVWPPEMHKYRGNVSSLVSGCLRNVHRRCDVKPKGLACPSTPGISSSMDRHISNESRDLLIPAALEPDAGIQ